MANVLTIHPVDPQLRLIKKVVEVLDRGGIIVYPTDSCYALGCSLDSKQGKERIRKIRQLTEKHPFSIVCHDLAQVGHLAHMDNVAFRLIKRLIPGPYAFILPISRHMPRDMWKVRRRTIGFRVPDHPIVNAITAQEGRAIVSTSLVLPGEDEPMTCPMEIAEVLGRQVDLIIDGGEGGTLPTTVVEWVDDHPSVIREGCGRIDGILSA